jgi:hypothetical protein
MPVSVESRPPEETSDRLARRVFFGFVLTFILSRMVVMTGNHIDRFMGPTLHELELNSSP